MSPSVSDLSPHSTIGRQWDTLAERTEGIDTWCSRLPWQRSVDTAFGHRFTDEDHDSDRDSGTDSGFGFRSDLGESTDDAYDFGTQSNSPWDHELDDHGLTDRDHTGLHDNAMAYEPSDPDVVEITSGWAYAFRQRRLADGTVVLLPLDSVWAFASPIVVDQDPETELPLAIATRQIVDSLVSKPSWQIAFVTGMQRESALFGSLGYELSKIARLVEGESTDRCIASLDGGYDGFLSRRPRTFRRNLRAAERTALRSSISFESADKAAPKTTVRRLQRVEEQSWKGLEGSGITSPDMGHLYALLVGDLHAVGGLRVTFATKDGTDIGFILGGVLGGSYRGLQLSFVENARRFSIGNLLQSHEIKRLADEGVIRYDLGMDMPYKRLWSDELMTTTPMVIVR